jgi:hypothetical protein
MKRILVLGLFLIPIFVANAQTPETIATTSIPNGEIEIVDEFLYRGGLNQEVVRIDITDSAFPTEIVAQGSESGTYLRFTIDETTENVFLSDIENEVLLKSPIVDGSTSSFSQLGTLEVGVLGLDFYEGRLYFSTAAPQIISLDCANPDNSLALVFDSPDPFPIFNIEIVGDFLYYSTQSSFDAPIDWQIFRLDLTQTVPVPELVTTTQDRIWSFAAIDDFLYLGSDQGERVTRINLNNSFPTNDEVVLDPLPLEPSEELFSIAHDGQFLYYSTNEGVFRLADDVLSIPDVVGDSFLIYPNPASNVLNIERSFQGQFTSENYAIIDASGREIVKGNLSNEKNIINVSSLQKGLYFVKIQSDLSKKSYKFIKQ